MAGGRDGAISGLFGFILLAVLMGTCGAVKDRVSIAPTQTRNGTNRPPILCWIIRRGVAGTTATNAIPGEGINDQCDGVANIRNLDGPLEKGTKINFNQGRL
jgi:hypothetical protein